MNCNRKKKNCVSILPLSWESTEICRLKGYFEILNGGGLDDVFMWLLTGPLSEELLSLVWPLVSSLNSGNAVCLNGYLQGDFGGSISNASFPTPSNCPRFDNLL